MPVTEASHDLDGGTLTIVAQFDAPVDRVFGVYADARQLERVWGPPEYPATFVDHDLTPGGRMNYVMTGPDGLRYAGYWEILTVEEPHGFTFNDGFSHEDLTPNTELPVSHNDYRFVEELGETRVTYTSTFDSPEALQQALDMGVVTGATSAINQIDDLLVAREWVDHG
ncbi:MAG: SRPBCC domain-containing protein [Ornithinimicrobium sp.]|uniref:SRPBCC family protein n=1 Tax=Ornithinimicrobium sp. TaxID=1977084 RepID=UPI0026E0276C|nr:SRPBCC domain-containing protein [Ornithinimicrobium sp.]MDO5741228.1 SRPBCC domain-containing protein [Ornithinimicrobium sp.]